MTSDGKSIKTPMFEAINAARYERQRLFRRIHELSGTTLVAYVGGPASTIDRLDGAYFQDLLYHHPPDNHLDVMIHTPGGDIDAAEKILSILRLRVGNSRLRAVVPDFAKSAGTMMAIGMDEIVMGDTSELGPIDPQLVLTDETGNKTTWSVQSYIDAYEELEQRLKDNPVDVPAKMMFEKLSPSQVVHFRAVCQRARSFAEASLRRGMCRETGNYTAVASRLLNSDQYRSHGQVINVEAALELGLKVQRKEPSDPWWDACWRLYCLQRQLVEDGHKLFESEQVSLHTSL